MLKLCRVTKVKVLYPVLVYVFNFNIFEFSAAILEKGLLPFTFLVLNTNESLPSAGFAQTIERTCLHGLIGRKARGFFRGFRG